MCFSKAINSIIKSLAFVYGICVCYPILPDAF